MAHSEPASLAEQQFFLKKLGTVALLEDVTNSALADRPVQTAVRLVISQGANYPAAVL